MAIAQTITVITVDGGDVDAGIEVEYAVKNKEKI
jgi:hypothetical protein